MNSLQAARKKIPATLIFAMLIWVCTTLLPGTTQRCGEAATRSVSPLVKSLSVVKPATWVVAIVRSSGRKPVIDTKGTGFFVSPRYFVTVAHNIEIDPGSSDEIGIYQPIPGASGAEVKSPLTVVHLDRKADIAVLKAPFSSQSHLTVKFEPLDDGESIAVYGYPVGDPTKEPVYGRVTTGVIAAQNRPADDGFIQTTISSFGGNSGGPLFLIDTAEVIGVQKGRIRMASGEYLPGYSLALPIRLWKEALNKLLQE